MEQMKARQQDLQAEANSLSLKRKLLLNELDILEKNLGKILKEKYALEVQIIGVTEVVHVPKKKAAPKELTAEQLIAALGPDKLAALLASFTNSTEETES
jgi:hypothetical protein